MFQASLRYFAKTVCLVLLSWSSVATALSLGSPQQQSRPGEPLRIEIPIRTTAEDAASLETLQVAIANKSAFARLGISGKLLELNPQAMIYRGKQGRLFILVETVESVPLSDDPFLDLLINLTWASGSINKAYTLLLGDTQKIIVQPGQSLSEIAAQLASQLDGASLDQTMMALFKANPDAFASGSINKLAAGVELTKPSAALLRSISPAEANQFVTQSREEWRAEQAERSGQSVAGKAAVTSSELQPKDRLKIGSSTDSTAEQKRYTEELVAQEKVLEQTRAKVAELEKNIADLQRLLDKSKQQKSVEPNLGLGSFAPAVVAIGLIALTGLLLWFLARHARRDELQAIAAPLKSVPIKSSPSNIAMPERAKALFAGLDLNLPPSSQKQTPSPISQRQVAEAGPLADTLRVKLNLARAYITIEDFSAAKKSLAEILAMSNAVDPTITIEAQSLLAELQHRSH